MLISQTPQQQSHSNEIEKIQSDLNRIRCLSVYWNIEEIYPHGIGKGQAPIFFDKLKTPFIQANGIYYVHHCIPSLTPEEIAEYEAMIRNTTSSNGIYSLITYIYQQHEYANSNYPLDWNSFGKNK